MFSVSPPRGMSEEKKEKKKKKNDTQEDLSPPEAKTSFVANRDEVWLWSSDVYFDFPSAFKTSRVGRPAGASRVRPSSDPHLPTDTYLPYLHLPRLLASPVRPLLSAVYRPVSIYGVFILSFPPLVTSTQATIIATLYFQHEKNRPHVPSPSSSEICRDLTMARQMPR